MLIVDEFTGRVLVGRRYNEGMHQAIEAKEKVEIKAENQTLATITLQNYFRLYEKLSGMTGTAADRGRRAAPDLQARRRPDPDEPPMVRVDQADLIYKTEEAKFDAVVDDVAERHEKGQPVLVGTTSVETSEYLSQAVAPSAASRTRCSTPRTTRGRRRSSPQAGRSGAVTVATNMAGRGTDIVLGGNPDFIADLRPAQAGARPGRDARRSTRPPGTPALEEAKAAGQGGARRRCATPAGCTCWAPSGTSPGGSTTSCAAAPAVRATRASRGSTSRSATT